MSFCTKPDPKAIGSSKSVIGERLEAAHGQWVSAWDLSRLAIEYKRPIWQLRHQDGITIENKTVRVRGKVHGYYRIPRYAGEQAPPLPEQPTAAAKATPKVSVNPRTPTEQKQGPMFAVDSLPVKSAFLDYETGRR